MSGSLPPAMGLPQGAITAAYQSRISRERYHLADDCRPLVESFRGAPAQHWRAAEKHCEKRPQLVLLKQRKPFHYI